MDRRQQKTREAIFHAFIDLLAQNDFEHITVAEIIDSANVGRATFYSHFETKDFLIKELCEELFCHILDAVSEKNDHKHIFRCNAPKSVFLHLFQHLQRNDNRILDLFSCKSNELFLRYFKNDLVDLIKNQIGLFEHKKDAKLPDSLWINHITSTFVETVRWWVDNGKKETPEVITEYFFLIL